MSILTGLSVGALLALNAASTLQRFGSVTLIGQLVSIGMVTELGPLITGLMVAGRNASGMASELGSMIVTEQIDAMRALGTDPTKKLITPRIGATAFMLFFLTIIADLLGLIGGYGVAHLLFGVDTHQYWTSVWQILVFRDVFTGLIKPVLFGFIIATVGCYYGMSTRGRHAGCRPLHDPGRGRFLGADSDGGFLRYQVDLRHFRLQISHVRSHSAQRKSGGRGGESLRLRHRVRQRLHCVR